MNITDKYPDFYCVGAGKSGTTSLYEIFKHHPQVFLPSVKEPFYFAEESIHKKEFTKEDYLKLYENSLPNQITGDFSPGYFMSPTAAERIYTCNQNAKIIIIMRDPVTRAYSDYIMYKRTARVNTDFVSSIKEEVGRINSGRIEDPFFVYTGCYGTHVKRFFDIFHRGNILILFMDDLIRQPRALYTSVCDFLKIDDVPIKDSTLSKKGNEHVEARSSLLQVVLYSKLLNTFLGKIVPSCMKNAGHLIRKKLIFHPAAKPEMPQEAWALLLPIFHEEIKKLQGVIGDDALRLSVDWPKID